MFSLEFKANVMVSGVVPALSQYVQPCVCCSWGLWLLLNSSRCLLGFLFFPTLMFLRVFGLQSEEKTNRTPSWSVCLQCDYFRPFPHPSWGGRDPLAGHLDSSPVSHTLALYSPVSSILVAYKAPLIPPSFPCLFSHLSAKTTQYIHTLVKTNKDTLLVFSSYSTTSSPSTSHCVYTGQELKEVNCSFLQSTGHTQCLTWQYSGNHEETLKKKEEYPTIGWRL